MGTAWVTGAKGFIGRALVLQLRDAGHTVCGIGHGHLPADLWAAAGLAHWSNSEITAEALGQLVAARGTPELVFHLAGGSAVGPSLSAPLEDFMRTAGTTARLLEWLRTHSPRSKLVVASSAAVYGDAQGIAAEESRPPSPVSPYGFHKLMMEQLCREYSQVFGLETAVLRMFSVYGEGVRKQLLWDCSGKLMAESDSIELGGTGQELRDWIHVDDAVAMMRHVAALAGVTCPIFNGGSGVPVKVCDIVAMLSQSLHRPKPVRFSGISRPGDPVVLVANTTRINSTGISCRIPLDVGIKRFADWFRHDRGA